MTAVDRPVLPWRIVLGVFLHVALPAYLLIGLACGAAGLLGGLSPAALATRVVPYSTGFALVYAAAALVATGAAAMLDPPLRRRRARRDPDGASSRASRQRLATALAEGHARLAPAAGSLLDAIAAGDWHHEEAAFQAISTDLAQVVTTATAALATATPARRQDVIAVTSATLSRIALRLKDLQDERRRLDEGDLDTVARYIANRYPPSDTTGDSVG